MLLVSFLLVIVATVFLVSGLFLTKDLALIFISIGCSALAGLILVVAVLRSRPKPAEAPLEGGPPAAPPAVEEAERAGATASPKAPAVPDRPAAAGRPSGPAFPIGNYDDLEVVEVLPLLGDLAPAELELVRQREAAGRAHPWILARIDALLESEAETGEWSPARAGGAYAGDEAEEAAGTDLDWAEDDEWAPSRSGKDQDWSAADFPLESAEETLFDAGYGAPAPRSLPIVNYDNLRANEVMRLLPDLTVEELRSVRQAEAAGKARTSILSRIDTLLSRAGVAPGGGAAKAPVKKAPAKATGPKGPSKAALSLPIANYDNLTVAQITAQLANLSAAELRALRTYERRHKARQGVLMKIENALSRTTR